MNYRMQEIKVGLMVVICFLLLIFFVFVISGIDFKKETVTYTTQLQFVGGLEIGTPVRLGGVMVGRISGISFPEKNSKRIKITIELDSDTPVKVDSRAYMSSIGMLGEYYIEIDPGSLESETLPPGSEITPFDVSSFSQLSTAMGDMAASAETTITRINQLLGPENQRHLTGILSNVNQLTADNSKHINQMLKNFETLSFDLIKISGKMDTMLSNNDFVIQKMMHHFDSTLVESKNLLMQTQNSLRALDDMVTSNTATYQSIMNSLEKSTINLEEFSRSIRERPWSLVRKSEPKPRAIPDK